MRNVRIRVSYDGARFFGWQRQEGFHSVQQELEEALLVLTGARVVVHGAGRTDTGVHALGQVAHFHVDTRLTDDRLRHALNAHTSPALVVERAETCPDAFHARFDARSKRYAYFVSTRRFRSPIAADRAHWVQLPLDLARMRAAARRLVGTHDFRAFGNTGSPRKSTVRTLSHARIVARRKGLALVFQADGFLYNMVRNLAGTLLEVGLGKRAVEDVERALSTGEREAAGATAPACGLYLVSVQYPDRPFRTPDDAGAGAPGAFGVRR
jgi:tRNA pseudouridine38-40 synthase